MKRTRPLHPAVAVACEVLGCAPVALRTRRRIAADAKSLAVGLLLRDELAHDEIHRRLRLHSHRGMVAYHAQRHQDLLDTSRAYERAYAAAVDLIETRQDETA